MEDRSRRRATLFTILGVVFALLAGGGTYLVASSANTAPPPPEEKGPVVVAARDLLARQAITAADVTIAQFPKTLIPVAAETDVTKVVGRVLTVPVVRGEVILPTKYATAQAAFSVIPPEQKLTETGALPPGAPNYRVLVLTVPDLQAAGGILQPGDNVDIVATVQVDPAKFFTGPADPNRVADTAVRTILENMVILARTGGAYTFRVPEVTLAEKLIYLQSSGVSLTLLLRPPKDERVINSVGATYEAMFKEFKFPIGKKFPLPNP